MRKLLVRLLFISTLLSFKPGVGTAHLTCKSASGRTLFTAELEECEFLRSAEFTVDDVKITFSYSNDEGYIVFDPENKVFTILLNSGAKSKGYKFLKFWAIPASFKQTMDENGPGSEFHHKYEFRAFIYGKDPRSDKDPNTPLIELNCQLDYRL
jgi:hypothetical protein